MGVRLYIAGRGKSPLFAGRHHLTAGPEWRYGFRGEQLNYDEPEYYLYLHSREKATDVGTYVQGKLAARDNLLLSAGIRYDHYSTFEVRLPAELSVVPKSDPGLTDIRGQHSRQASAL